jgi:5-methylcytosine-specific restriction endonuclease McrA
MREKISPSLRAEILTRSGCACELCHRVGIPLSVGHLLSLEAGKASGIPESELNSEENLAAMCDACNLGLGKHPVPLRVMLSIITTRCRNIRRKMGME